MITIISVKGKLLKVGQNRDTIFVVDEEKYEVRKSGNLYVYEKVIEDVDAVVPVERLGKLLLVVSEASLNFKVSMDYDKWYDMNEFIDWDYSFGASISR